MGSNKCRKLEDRHTRHRRDKGAGTCMPTTTCHVCFEGTEPPTIECLEQVEFLEHDHTHLFQAETRHQ
jgi:hypothetical protein